MIKEIEHLVISGGGPALVQTMGVIEEIENQKLIDIKNIKSIYASSAGAVCAMLFCLHRDCDFDWITINDFIINRPWEDIFMVDINTIINSYYNCGLFNEETLVKCFESFFNAKDIPLNISLKDFYEKYSKIDLHFFTFEFNSFQLIDISWKTHPDIRLFQALHMTCSLPILFSPVFIDHNEHCIQNDITYHIQPDKPLSPTPDNTPTIPTTDKNIDGVYIDGGIISNYPLKYCLMKCDENTILGIKNVYDIDTSYNRKLNKTSTLFDYLLTFIFKLIYFVSDKYSKPIKYEINCNTEFMSFDTIKNTVFSIDTRRIMIENGKNIVSNWCKQIK